MVITTEDFGGGRQDFYKPPGPEEEPILEELNSEDLEKIVDQLKPLWPLAAIPVVIQLWNRFKKREDDVPWEAIARAIAPIVAPIILSVLWVALTKVDKKIDWLSNMIAVAEILPTVDLNIPQGVVLGSMYSSAEDVQKILTAVVEAGERLAGLDPKDIIPKVPEDSTTEKLFRAFAGGDPIGTLIADLVFGKE
jgi:hypothetical protein